MDGRNVETIGVRRTGWAALDRDPQQDKVEFVCPYCGARDEKNARRERALYHFTDGFLQDLQGEVTQCHACKRSLRVVPVVLLHDRTKSGDLKLSSPMNWQQPRRTNSFCNSSENGNGAQHFAPRFYFLLLAKT